MVSLVKRTFREEMESSMVFSEHRPDTRDSVFIHYGGGERGGYHRIAVGEFRIISRMGYTLTRSLFI